MSRFCCLLVGVIVVVSGCAGSATDRCGIDGVDPLLGQLAGLGFEIDGIPPLAEATSASAASPEAFDGNDLRCEVLAFGFDHREGIDRLSISSFLTFDAAEDSLEHAKERFDLELDPESQVWIGEPGIAIAQIQERCLRVSASGPDMDSVVSAVLAVRDALSVQCASRS